MRSLALLFTSFSLLASALAQITTTDASGETIVEVVTLNPAGLPTTQIIQTLQGQAPPGQPPTSPSTTPLTTPTTPTPLTPTPPVGQQGPVGQPPHTTGPAPPTVYQYTTTDALGETIAVQDTFTPTFAPTVQSIAPATGTIVGYSQWLSLIGTNTVAAASDASVGSHLSSSWLALVTGLVSCVVGGAYLVFL